MLAATLLFVTIAVVPPTLRVDDAYGCVDRDTLAAELAARVPESEVARAVEVAVRETADAGVFLVDVRVSRHADGVLLVARTLPVTHDACDGAPGLVAAVVARELAALAPDPPTPVLEGPPPPPPPPPPTTTPAPVSVDDTPPPLVDDDARWRLRPRAALGLGGFALPVAPTGSMELALGVARAPFPAVELGVVVHGVGPLIVGDGAAVLAPCALTLGAAWSGHLGVVEVGGRASVNGGLALAWGQGVDIATTGAHPWVAVRLATFAVLFRAWLVEAGALVPVTRPVLVDAGGGAATALPPAALFVATGVAFDLALPW